APPAARSAAVALPCWIFFTRPLFVPSGSATRHTLASYLSMHTAPDTTASGVHFSSAPLGGPAAPAARVSRIIVAATVTPCLMHRVLPYLVRRTECSQRVPVARTPAPPLPRRFEPPSSKRGSRSKHFTALPLTGLAGELTSVATGPRWGTSVG